MISQEMCFFGGHISNISLTKEPVLVRILPIPGAFLLELRGSFVK